jgi:tricarballylate dehydrogenase
VAGVYLELTNISFENGSLTFSRGLGYRVREEHGGDAMRDLIVVGCGIAGLSAAVAAAERGANVIVLERAPKSERGGQSRYTEAYLRMKSDTEVTDDFETHLADNAGYYVEPGLIHEMSADFDRWPRLVKSLSFADPEFISAFSDNAGPTVAWLKSKGVRFDFLPTQFLTKSQPRLLPIGGGEAIVEALATEAELLGATFLYETCAIDLLFDDTGAVSGVVTLEADGRRTSLAARSVVLACGGFEGNPEMLARYLGPRSAFLRPICRGGHNNKGEGVAMALKAGAAPCGEYGSYHAEPIDPRSSIAEPSVFIFPYGILVNRKGERFVDEAPGTIDAHYEPITRRIYEQERGIAFAILDAKHMEIPNYRLALRTDAPPIEAQSIGELAAKLGIEPESLSRTVAQFNAACGAGDYRPLQVDGLSTVGLNPPKSNWAHRLDKAPFHAYPIISANVFTFGGVKVDRHACVLNVQGDAIPGLYAAGEVIGCYYGNYTGATSVLKAAIFGRAAGAHCNCG